MSRRLESFAVDGTHFLFVEGENYGIYLTDEMEGLDAPEYFEDFDALSGENGEIINNALYRGRNIIVNGHVYSTSDAQYEELRKIIINLGTIRKNVYGDVELKKVEIWTKGGAYYYTYGTVRHSIKWVKHTHAKWMLFIHCPDPFIRGGDRVEGPITRPLGGGAMIPATVPFTVSSGGGGSLVIVNAGSAPVWPIWTFRGELHSPRLSLGTRAFKLNLDLTAGEYVTVNTDPTNITIIKNGTDNVITSLDDADYDLFELDPGSNTILFSSSESTDTGTVEAEVYDSYLGI